MAARHSKLKAAVRAAWRNKAKEEMERRGEALPEGFQLEQPGDGDLEPPDARRVARRALVLSAVAIRGLAYSWPQREQASFLPALQGWFSEQDLDDEAELTEREVILAAAGELDQRTALNACWRWEGAAVLVAALGRFELPTFENVVETKACGDATGLLADSSEVSRMIDTASFSSGFDRFAFADQMLAVNWRLTEWRANPGKTDFVAFAKRVTWATFDLRGTSIVEGDLSVGGKAISKADAEVIGNATSIVSERHHAANWLAGWATLYSDVETPT